MQNKNLLIGIIIAIIVIGGAVYAFTMQQNYGVMTGDDALMKKDVAMDDTSINKRGEGMVEDYGNMKGDAMMDEVKTINLTGANFAFSQDEIRVKKGDKVKIVFTSTDGFHDWVVDEFNAATNRVNTGEKTSVEFVADKAGTFEYYCSVGRHREMGMKGNLIVEE